MTSGPPLPPGTPAGVPPQWPGWPSPAPVPQPRESRGVAFFVAIFLGLLLIASAGLNVLLLLLSVGSLAGAGLGGESNGSYDEVHVAGERGHAKVLQVPIHGAIAESQTPLLGAPGGTVTQVKRALRLAAADDVVGIVLHIDSPGGGVTDSDEVHGMIRRFRAEHPKKKVVALFGDVAASGGYYIACAAEHIIARRTSITGSIGVIMSAWNFAEAAKKLGVDQIAIKSERTPYKDILSPTRPMRADEHELLVRIVDELYDQFVTIVDDGRPNLDRAQVLAAATGAIYTASQARELGLVDELGDHEAVLAWFHHELGEPVTIVEPRRRPGLADLLLGAFGSARGADAAVDSLLNASSGPRFLYFWEGGR